MTGAQADWYLQVNLKARQLRLLVALDDFGNLRQVAALSHVTVPAISKALAELEKGLGLKLFTRSMQGLRPTVYGECLIRHARNMLVSLHHARDELRALSAGVEGQIRIGVFPAWTSALLPTALALFKQQAPKANVLIMEGTAQTLLPQLWQGQLDLLVGRLPPRNSHSDIEELELLEDPLVLMTGPDHPLACRRRMQWSDLADYPWVLPPANSQLRAPLEGILQQHGIALSGNCIETLSTHLVRPYLYMTEAIAVMAGAVAKDPVQPLHILPLALPRLMRPAGVMWARSRTLAPGARGLIGCLQQAAGQLSPRLAARESVTPLGG